jgi:hypothetical protein
MLTHLHMVIYTQWCWHICKGGEVWGVERGLRFLSPSRWACEAGFGVFMEIKCLFSIALRNTRRMLATAASDADVSVRCLHCRGTRGRSGHRCVWRYGIGLAKHLAVFSGFVTSAASSNLHVHRTQWCPLTHHRTRPMSKNHLWLLTRVHRTLGVGHVRWLWMRKAHGEIWCTGRCWVRLMPVRRSVRCPRFLPSGSIRKGVTIYTCLAGFGTTLDSLNTWDILWARELPLHSSLCLVAYSSEIEWDSSALLSDLHLVTLDLWVGCEFLVTLGCFPTS